MNRLAILSNAGSGRNAGSPRPLDMLDGLTGVEHRLTQSVEELPAALDTLLATGPAALAVNGGDGTLQVVLTELRGRAGPLPPLAVLPGGTTNMSARDLGGGGSLLRALQAFLTLRDRPLADWPLEGRSVLEVHSGHGDVQMGLFFGIGTIVRGVEFWRQELGRSRRAGEWGAGLALARGAWGILRRQPPFADATTVSMTLSGQEQSSREVSLLLVTTMRRLFLGLTPFWGTGREPLACTWLDASPRRVLGRLPALLRGRARSLFEEEGYFSRRLDRLVLDFDDAWLLDGEVFPASGRLEMLPSRPLEFIRLDAGRP